ncbi:Uncharacterised protein [Mycobacteroides abscessus subsp. abscessus]|nr:Uncharacterised protein [Mycobacteroides abscessus subsp. abscessus]
MRSEWYNPSQACSSSASASSESSESREEAMSLPIWPSSVGV